MFKDYRDTHQSSCVYTGTKDWPNPCIEDKNFLKNNIELCRKNDIEICKLDLFRI